MKFEKTGKPKKKFLFEEIHEKVERIEKPVSFFNSRKNSISSSDEILIDTEKDSDPAEVIISNSFLKKSPLSFNF